MYVIKEYMRLTVVYLFWLKEHIPKAGPDNNWKNTRNIQQK